MTMNQAIIPKVFVTSKEKGSASFLPSPVKGILISPGFREKPISEKVKTVIFADGVRPGEDEETGIKHWPNNPSSSLTKVRRIKKSKKVFKATCKM